MKSPKKIVATIFYCPEEVVVLITSAAAQQTREVSSMYYVAGPRATITLNNANNRPLTFARRATVVLFLQFHNFYYTNSKTKIILVIFASINFVNLQYSLLSDKKDWLATSHKSTFSGMN